jgi:metal-responsive CopG/Arc/MetJ family transcriptional regulator
MNDDEAFVEDAIEFTVDQWEAIDDMARRTGRSRSQIVRVMIDVYLARQGETDPDANTEKPV